jgi:hypothetical protein
MQLHNACRQKLIECLTKGLREVTFKNKYALDYSSFRSLDSCSLVLPIKIQELASNWISQDNPLTTFSYGFVVEWRSLYAETLNKFSKEDFPVRLPDLTDIAQMATQIADAFATLPWEYEVVLPFASTAGLDFSLKQLPLSKELSLKKSSELRPFPEIPESPFVKLLSPATDWSTDKLYL